MVGVLVVDAVVTGVFANRFLASRCQSKAFDLDAAGGKLSFAWISSSKEGFWKSQPKV